MPSEVGNDIKYFYIEWSIIILLCIYNDAVVTLLIMQTFSYCVMLMFLMDKCQIISEKGKWSGKPTQRGHFIVICDNEDTEDDEDDESYEETSNKRANEGMFLFVIEFICLCYDSAWTKASVFFVSVILLHITKPLHSLYASIILILLKYHYSEAKM